MISLGEFVLIILLIFLNGFFVAAEAALLNVRQTQIEALNLKSKKLISLIKEALANLTLYVSATQLGNTVTGVALGWWGHPIIERTLVGILPFQPQNTFFWNATSIAVSSFLVLTFFNLMFGELLPKTAAIRNPVIYSLILITPLFIFVKIFLPLIKGLNRLSDTILHFVGVGQSQINHRLYSESEIKIILDESSRNQVIPEGVKTIASNVFQLKKIKATDIMIPAGRLVGFWSVEKLEVIKSKILNSELCYHYYPIYAGPVKKIIGFIRMADIMKFNHSPITQKRVINTDLVKKIIYVQPQYTLDEILIRMQKHQRFAVAVADNSNHTLGFIDFDDIIVNTFLI